MKSPAVLLVVFACLAAVAWAILFSGGGQTARDGELVSSALVVDALEADLGEISLPEPKDKEAVGQRSVVETPVKAKVAKQAKAQPKGPFLSGFVIDQDGNPIEGALVRLQPEEGASIISFMSQGVVDYSATTDLNGAFKIPRSGLKGALRARIQARGFQSYWESCESDTDSGEGSLGELRLKVGVVFGGVVEDEEGQPVAGAVVSCQPLDWGAYSRFMHPAQTTGEDGRFEFENEAPGKYQITAKHAKLPASSVEVDGLVPGLENTDMVISLESSVPIEGRIVGALDEDQFVFVYAVPSLNGGLQLGSEEDFIGMVRRLSPNFGVLGADGQFQIEGLDYTQVFEVMAVIRAGTDSWDVCSSRRLVNGGAQGVRLDWVPAARITFDVRDSESGQAVSSGSVFWLWKDRVYRGARKTDFEGGHTELTGLRPGEPGAELSIQVSAPGYMTRNLDPVKVKLGEEIDLGTIELAPPVQVRVHVVDAVSGKPIKRARIQLSPDVIVDESDAEDSSTVLKSNKARTAKDGWCEVPGVASQTATLTVRRSGYAPYVLPALSMPASEPIEVELVEGAELSISIVDTNGDPVPKAGLTYRGPNALSGSSTANSKGILRLKDLMAGQYKFLVNAKPKSQTRVSWTNSDDEQAKPEWHSMVVVASVKQDLTLVVPVETQLTGVIRVNGVPVQGAKVAFVRGRNPEPGESQEETGSFTYWGAFLETTNAKGGFTLKTAEPGSHRLRIHVTEGSVAHNISIELLEGSNDQDIDLEVGQISGTVTDLDGNPIPGAMVSVEQSYTHLSAAGRNAIMRSFAGGEGEQEVEVDGHFEVLYLPVGVPLGVTVTAPGYVRKRSSEDIEAGAHGLTYELFQGGGIDLTVVGEMADMFWVQAEGPDQKEATMVRGGVAKFEGLGPGLWKLYVGGGESGKTSQVVEVTVVAGQTAKAVADVP